MGRLFVFALILLLLAFAPVEGAKEEDQPVFFSLLFPQLMPEESLSQWLGMLLGDAAGEAVAL